MANGDPLPDAEHVTRSGARGHTDGEFTSAAFAMRPGVERETRRISADRVECPAVGEDRRTPEASVERLKANRVGGPYAILNVSDIRLVRRGDNALDILEQSTRNNQCHCPGFRIYVGMKL